MIHTPELSFYHLDLITEKTGMYFENASYKNDATDSLGLGSYLTLYLPNSGKNDSDNEQFSTFHLSVSDTDNVIDFELTLNSIDEVIEFFTSSEGKVIYHYCQKAMREENEKILDKEKEMIFKEFEAIKNDLLGNPNLLTSDMLRRIRDKAINLIETDF